MTLVPMVKRYRAQVHDRMGDEEQKATPDIALRCLTHLQDRDHASQGVPGPFTSPFPVALYEELATFAPSRDSPLSLIRGSTTFKTTQNSLSPVSTVIPPPPAGIHVKPALIPPTSLESGTQHGATGTSGAAHSGGDTDADERDQNNSGDGASASRRQTSVDDEEGVSEPCYVADIPKTASSAANLLRHDIQPSKSKDNPPEERRHQLLVNRS